MRSLSRLAVCGIAGITLSLTPDFAQTVTVDATPSHSTNHFIPRETLGAGIDRIPKEEMEKLMVKPTLERVNQSGWQTLSYRQNTELLVENWHWNPEGTWSDPAGKGYFTGSAAPRQLIRHSYGYALPHRGFTRNDGTGNAGYSRITDGDVNTYWKSNPYLTERYTGESDALHPQWVIVDIAQPQLIDSIRILWGEPYAKNYLVQYWAGDDPIKLPLNGVWRVFSSGSVSDGKGGTATIKLSESPIPVRFIRIWMTGSSNTCDSHGTADPRNCVGYAIKELYVGTSTPDGTFHDILRHMPEQEQTATFCSSVDPWHEPADMGNQLQSQMGFDLFFTSGVTHGLPAMVPVALLYDTPENAVNEIKYLKAQNYPISYVEMGEEADGQYMLPEDYAALYVQWAAALHRLDPTLKLGGPSFQGVNKDIDVWPDSAGRVSWVRRFLLYLEQHNRMSELSFFSFEHYPYDPCKTPWGSLYDEPDLVSHIMQTWRDDGVPANLPMFITESNLSWAVSETYMDMFSGIWLADYIGSFLSAGGQGVYYFHYLPLVMEHGCNDSPGTIGMFTLDSSFHIQQPLAQFFVSQLINQEWVQSRGGEHKVFPVRSDVSDGAGHALVTAYALARPDGQWSLMLVNRDQEAGHAVKIRFHDEGQTKDGFFSGPAEVVTFGSAQYKWHPAHTDFLAHAEHPGDPQVMSYKDGWADPDGPAARSSIAATENTSFELPAASVTVIRGKLAPRPPSTDGPQPK